MKKQDFTSISLKLKKVNISNLTITAGAQDPTTVESYCCSKPITCPRTITTRPDSLANS